MPATTVALGSTAEYIHGGRWTFVFCKNDADGEPAGFVAERGNALFSSADELPFVAEKGDSTPTNRRDDIKRAVIFAERRGKDAFGLQQRSPPEK